MRAFSSDIFENLFYLYLAIALIVGGAVLGWLFYSMWRYRWRPGAPRPADAPRPGVIPAERGHVLWVYIMAGGIAVIMFGLAFGTISATDTLENPPVEDANPELYMEITGFQFGWRFNYIGEGGVPFNKIGELTIPVNTNVVANITSQDVWHNFAVPDYRIRIDVIPGEVNRLWWRATQTGTGHTVCVQLCGSGHANMRATLQAVDQAAFDQFMKTNSDQAYNALGRAGNLRNVTITDSTIELDNATVKGTPAGPARGPTGAPTPIRGVGIVLKNDAASPQEVRFSTGQEVRVEPGATARIFVQPPSSGVLTVSTNNATASFQVVS